MVPARCPVCRQELTSALCSRCGYDESRQYTRYPTLVCLPGMQQRGRSPRPAARSAPSAPEVKDPALRYQRPLQSSGGFRSECGLPRPAAAPQGRAPTPPPPRKKERSLRWLWLLLCLAVLAGATAACYRMVHIWAPASCTKPETCFLCGKTMGEALGHEIREASCTEPETCIRCGQVFAPALGHAPIPASCLQPSLCERCGETLSPALGHDWMTANYDRPETCSRCGETQGSPKGWVGDLTGHVSDETLNFFGDGVSHPYLLDRPLYGAYRLTVGLKISSWGGSPFGVWGLYARDLNGKWELLSSFTVPGDGDGEFQCFPLQLDGAHSFDALSFLPLTEEDYDIGYSFYYTDAQEFVD